jgi:hypothetical protein
MKRKREYLKDKIKERGTNSRNKNKGDLCRGINEFKRTYQLRTGLIKDENGDLLAYSHSILNRINYFVTYYAIQNEIQTDELSVTEPSYFGV